ncbi:MAG: SpoIIE family protein phosphatase [Verrucomicrobia bacterium]|nr:SpoIIE family protein phosphatase [Verrucomicrobiota bacterium]
MTTQPEKKTSAFSNLVEIAAAINSGLDPDDVLPNILDLAQRTMDATATSVALVDNATQELVYVIATGKYGERVKQNIRLKPGHGIAGWVAQNNQALVINDVINDPRFNRAAAEKAGLIPRSMICVPMRVRGKVIGILQAIDPRHKPAFDQDDGEFFEGFASLAATAISNAQMHKALLKQQSEQQERNFARQIQQSFLPREMPPIPGVTIHACNESALAVGGDFYDVIQLSPTKVALIIGDITGKGVAASLYMVRCLFDTRRSCSVAGENMSPAGLLTAKNNILANEAFAQLATEMSASQAPHPPIFVGMICVTFDAASGELCYANAGLPDPILQVDGRSESLSSSGGPALGMVLGMTFNEDVRMLHGGETLLLFTDGLSEARNIGNVEFDRNRIAEALAQPHDNAKAAVESVSRNVLHFIGSAPRHDDLTMMALHFVKS